MILGFQAPFKAPILAGSKIHSVRDDIHERWRPGMVIHMSTGVRTKAFTTFKVARCTAVESMVMTWDQESGLQVWLGDHQLTFRERMRFAVNDGFADLASFESWFIKVVKKKGGRYPCRLIHWTAYRYKFRAAIKNTSDVQSVT